MLEASIEAGRAPLHNVPEAQGELQRLSRHLLLRSSAFWILLAADIVLIPASFVIGFGFNFATLFSTQAGHFSLASSLLDWVIVCVLRDVFLAIYLLRSRSSDAEAASEHLRMVRRIATISMFYGIGRLALIDWKMSDTSSLTLLFVVSCVMLLTLSLASQMLLKSREQLEKERIRLTGPEEVPEEASDEQYSGSLTYLQTLYVLKPYFWPSTGEPSEVFCNRARAMSTWVCVAGSKGMNLCSPLFLARATNGLVLALQEKGALEIPQEVIWNLIFYAFFIFMGKALKECQELVYIKVQQAAYIEIASNTFEHLHTLSLDWHLKKKMGNVVRSMDRGISAAQSTMKYVFLYLLPTLMEAAAVAVIFVFHFNNMRLAVFLLLNLILYCYVTIKTTLWRKQFRTATTKHDNELHDRLTDSLVNYETIKYFTAEDYETTEYRSVVQKFQQMSMATQASLSFLNVVQQAIINFTLAGGMIIAAGQLLQDGGAGSVGQFVAVNAYIIQTFAPLSFLGTIYNMVINGIVDMKSFGQLLAESYDVADEPGCQILDANADSGCPMIEFRDVSFHYRRQPLARSVQHVSFSSARGSTTALVGTTGSGKTTITRLLFRFYDPLSGQVLVNGKDARAVTQKSLRQAIGFVPQDVVMFNASIEHNIKYGCIENCSHEQVQKAAEQAQMAAFIEQQPQGYDTAVGERGLKLSGGEKQRLAIARCLVKNPPIVVLDEATSALDSATEHKIQEALNILSASRTVVAIAHRLSTIRHFNEVLVLEGGQIVQRGSHDELMADDGGKYSEMWRRQVDACSAGMPIEPERESAPKAEAEPVASSPAGNGHGHGGGHGGGHG